MNPVENNFRQVKLDDTGVATVDWPSASGHAKKENPMQFSHPFDGAAQ